MKKSKDFVEDWPAGRTLKFSLSVYYPAHLERLDFKYRQLFEFATKSRMQSREAVAASIKYFANEISQQIEKGKHRKQFGIFDEPVHVMKTMKVMSTLETPEWKEIMKVLK